MAKRNGGTGPAKPAPLAAKIGELEARAQRMLATAATIQLEAYRLMAEASELRRQVRETAR